MWLNKGVGQMEKWLYREQANYRLRGGENACIVQCAMGTKYLWIGSVSSIAENDYRAMRVSVHQPSYDKLERGQFSTKEQAMNWIIDEAEAELQGEVYCWLGAVTPKHP